MNELTRPSIGGRRDAINVGGGERLVSSALGIALLWWSWRGERPRWWVAAGGGALVHRALSGQCPVYRWTGIDTRRTRGPNRFQIRRAITVEQPIARVYSFWRVIDGLPVSTADTPASPWHWQQPSLLQRRDAELTADEPERRISWRTLPGPRLQHEGRVRFLAAPGDRGTEIHVLLDVELAPRWTAALAVPVVRRAIDVQLGQELRRIKQLIETGDLVTSASRIEAEEGDAVGMGLPAKSPGEPRGTKGAER